MTSPDAERGTGSINPRANREFRYLRCSQSPLAHSSRARERWALMMALAVWRSLSAIRSDVRRTTSAGALRVLPPKLSRAGGDGVSCLCGFSATYGVARDSTPIQQFGRGCVIERTVKGEGGTSHMIVETDGLRWEITLPLNVTGTDALRTRNYPTKQAVLGPRIAQQASPPEPLREKRFLIVEDEPLIGLEVVAGLESVGVNVEGPVGSVEDALRAIDDDGLFDGVILDANLRGEPAGEIAAALTRRNIPFVFVTGYGRQALPESFGQCPMLTKPFTQEQLLQAAARLVGTVPPGLRLHKNREPRT